MLFPRFMAIPEALVFPINPPSLGQNSRSADIQIALQSSAADLDEFQEVSQALLARMREIPGLMNVDSDLRFENPQVNVRIDRENHALRVSAIFDWFGGDFVDTYDTGEPAFDDPRDRAIAAFVARFVSDADRAWLAAGDYRILYLEYDWNLNDRAQ